MMSYSDSMRIDHVIRDSVVQNLAAQMTLILAFTNCTCILMTTAIP